MQVTDGVTGGDNLRDRLVVRNDGGTNPSVHDDGINWSTRGMTGVTNVSRRSVEGANVPLGESP
jgi:hypothetical protein